MSRNPVDFSYIKPEHRQIDGRLHNWARWVRPDNMQYSSPMFARHKSSERWETICRNPPDLLDAQDVEHLVAGLKKKPRAAIRWWYVFGTPSWRVAKAQGLTQCELADLVHVGREMLRSK